eukprot:TRINITY_DN1767_c0_g1_i1.p1 TRINITY_DN1767_c0_g1~~TRINITY_DN1767_c0_g1_i1.p1  ORF type:complete len:589 (-),score=94.94 TRINITY_DN1767_c0_g1_i1:218-1984(-)
MGDEAEVPEKLLNFNIGVLGHVDSGKTSLCKALSTQQSTACFDKNPQSKERGITLDLGFSSFKVDAPEHLVQAGYNKIQHTLVDCPGHASLIRTIIGGAQIIDLMVLVVDITKGIQTQTAECIVIGEILAKDLIIVLNKIDMVPATETSTAEQQIERKKKKLRAVFSTTKWPNAPMICVAANPGAGNADIPPIGLDDLLAEFAKHTTVPTSQNYKAEDFLMYIDHCFAIKGQGTVITGTILQGCMNVGQNIDFPEHKVQRRVKSIQVFKKPVQQCVKGDRVGICVTQFDADNIERGIACSTSSSSGLIQTFSTAIAEIHRVRFYKNAVKSNSKVHITVGHTTQMATVRFFCLPLEAADAGDLAFDATTEYMWLPELPQTQDAPGTAIGCSTLAETATNVSMLGVGRSHCRIYAILFFEKPIVSAANSTMIASKLDVDVHATTCRLMFHGKLAKIIDSEGWKSIVCIKTKCKTAVVDRVVDDQNCIGNKLVKSGAGDITPFIGLTVHYQPKSTLPENLPCTEEDRALPIFKGRIEGTFGKSGKFKVTFSKPVFTDNKENTAYVLAVHFQINQFNKAAKQIRQPPGCGPT